MTKIEMETKTREYREMKRLAEEAQAAADSLADEIKAAMTEGMPEIMEAAWEIAHDIHPHGQAL